MKTKSRLEAKFESMNLVTHNQYLKKRLQFIKWARSERYTLQEIGKLLGTDKHGIYKCLKDEERRTLTKRLSTSAV